MEHSLKRIPKHVYSILDRLLDRVLVKHLSSDLSVKDAAILLSAKESPSVSAIAAAADACRAAAPCKDNVSYVVNRNINFTNACVMRCGFCAFSRTGIDEEAYFLPLEEIVRRAVEAANLDATEICIQVMESDEISIISVFCAIGPCQSDHIEDRIYCITLVQNNLGHRRNSIVLTPFKINFVRLEICPALPLFSKPIRSWFH